MCSFDLRRFATVGCAIFLSGLAFADGQTTQADKLEALSRPTSYLPVGQTVDVAELPPNSIRLDWMSRLPSRVPLSLISIPATHDAGTAFGKTGWTRCQVLTVPAQLALGIRGFDIRLRLVGDELLIYHSEESQSLKFEEVMKAFSSFLHAHPKELIVMRVREESKAINATEAFEQAFEKYSQGKQFRGLFYEAKTRTEIPTVGQVRGKILVLDNYGKLPDSVDYPNPTMGVQDDYDTSDMVNKSHEIIAKFDEALNEKTGSTWHVNYTSSCTLQVDQLANAVAVNPIVEAYLNGKHGHLGLVLTNFAGLSIIDSIIDSNF